MMRTDPSGIRRHSLLKVRKARTKLVRQLRTDDKPWGTEVRIISKSLLKEFWEQPKYSDSESPLKAWYTIASNRNTDWHNFSDVRETFSSAGIVDDCIVFNIGGNKYRLITRIRYQSHAIYTLKVMTHKEYDKKQWVIDCGCQRQNPR